MGNFIRTTPEKIQERLTSFFTENYSEAVCNSEILSEESPQTKDVICGNLRITVFPAETVTQIGTELNNLKDISQLLDLEKYILENYSKIKEFSIDIEEKYDISFQVRLMLKQ